MRKFVWASLACLLALSSMHLISYAQHTGPLIMAEGKELKDGDRYWIPGHTENNSLALFSESVQVITFYNKSSSEMVVNSVALELADGVVSEEFTLFKNEIKRTPLDFAETKLEASKGTLAFKVRFYPVESGERNATLTITYDTDKTYSLKLAGRGRGEAKFFSHGSTQMHKLFGDSKTDEILSTAVADAEGNIFFSGQVTQVVDRFSTDIFYARVNADGSLAWAKIWNGKFMDRSPDSGQNAETGGTANSLAIDDAGDIYLCGATSDSSSNSIFAALILKISGETGEIIWEQLWRPEWASSVIARHGAEAYGITVQGGRVFVTGSCIGNAEVMLVGLNAENGEVAFQRTFDPTLGSNDRGYAIVATADGTVYIGGLASDRSLLAKITGCNGDAPKLEWAQRVDMGRGSNINCLALCAEGNLYASLDRRGATTFFSAASFDTDGKLRWGKTYAGTAGDRNNTHMVRVHGDTVLVGGRLGVQGFDTSGGDGLLLALGVKDGSEKWSAFYYTGTGPDEACEHRIKGVVLSDDSITIIGQSYTGSRNGVRYHGYWYNGPSTLEDYAPGNEVLSLGDAAMKDTPKGGVKPAAEARTIVDLVGKLSLKDAIGHTGEPSDGDVAIWKIALNN